MIPRLERSALAAAVMPALVVSAAACLASSPAAVLAGAAIGLPVALAAALAARMGLGGSIAAVLLAQGLGLVLRLLGLLLGAVAIHIAFPGAVIPGLTALAVVLVAGMLLDAFVLSSALRSAAKVPRG